MDGAASFRSLAASHLVRPLTEFEHRYTNLTKCPSFLKSKPLPAD
jgi:hypothetical protein